MTQNIDYNEIIRPNCASATNYDNPNVSFPGTLTRSAWAGEGAAGEAWRREHNNAVRAFEGMPGTVRRSERAILSLAAGINQFVGSSDVDAYVIRTVLYPSLVAFGDALNMDLGRLDGGTLSGWAHATADRCGFDLDTGDMFTHYVTRDGEVQHRATSPNEAWMWMQRHTNQSHEWETTHNGWAIIPA